MILKHSDDDGDLSIFASGDEVLLTCPKGHYWLLKADKHKSAVLEAEDAELSLPESITERFGQSAVAAFQAQRV